MSNTLRTRVPSVGDAATLRYSDAELTGHVADVVRFLYGPRAGAVRKVAVRVDDSPTGQRYLVWYASDRNGGWASVGGSSTADFATGSPLADLRRKAY